MLAGAVAAALAGSASLASAQEIEGPLRFLKPWLEGLTEPQPNAAATPADPVPPRQLGEPPADVLPEDGAEAGLDGAALRSAIAPGEAAPSASSEAATGEALADPVGAAEGEASAVPPPGDDAIPQAEPILQPLRLGVIGGSDPAAMIRAVEPWTGKLGRLLGRTVEILPMSSYGAMIDAQALERIDGGFYSAAAFSAAQARCACLEPIVAPAAFDGSVAYHAIIVARRDSGISSIADLRGRTIVSGAIDSIGSRRLQLAALIAEGVDVEGDLNPVRNAGSAEEAVRIVAGAGADAAFAWSSLSGDLVTGYSRGTLTDLVARGEIAMNELAIIWSSPAITHGPVALRRSLPHADVAAIEAGLLELEGLAPLAYDVLNPFYSGGYVSVGAEDFDGLAAIYAQDEGEGGRRIDHASP